MAGAPERVRTVRPLEAPIGTITAVVVALPEEIGVSDDEVDLLTHWCGDLLAALGPACG